MKRQDEFTTIGSRPRRLSTRAVGLAMGAVAALGLLAGSGAASAATAHSAGLASGQYWYESTEAQIGSHPVERWQVWTDRDGNGSVISSTNDRWRFETGKTATIIDGHPTDPSKDWNFQVSATYEQIVNLPANDDAALARRLAALTPLKMRGGTYGLAVTLLEHAPLSTPQRVAIFRVVQSLPGVEKLGTVTDERDRTGVGAALVSDGIRERLVVDAATAAPLDAYNDVVDANAAAAANPGVNLADLAGRVTFLATGVIDSADVAAKLAKARLRHKRTHRRHGKAHKRAAHRRLAIGSGGAQPDTASAATVRAASLGPGQYWYEGTETQFGSHPASRIELWTGRDGRGRLISNDSDSNFAPHTFGPSWSLWIDVSYDQLAALPDNDDAALVSSLVALTRAESRSDAGIAGMLGTALRFLKHAPLSTGQRAAILRVIAKLPGVESLGTVRDERGRTGIGVAYVADGIRTRVIVTADTAAPLDEYADVVDANAASAANPTIPLEDLKARVTYLGSGVVTSVDSRPQGSQAVATSRQRHRAVKHHGKPRKRAAKHGRRAAR